MLLPKLALLVALVPSLASAKSLAYDLKNFPAEATSRCPLHPQNDAARAAGENVTVIRAGFVTPAGLHDDILFAEVDVGDQKPVFALERYPESQELTRLSSSISKLGRAEIEGKAMTFPKVSGESIVLRFKNAEGVEQIYLGFCPRK